MLNIELNLAKGESRKHILLARTNYFEINIIQEDICDFYSSYPLCETDITFDGEITRDIFAYYE